MVIENFINYLLAEKQYSELTATAYREDLHQFCLYLGETQESFDPAKVDHRDIRMFIMTLSQNSTAATTINRKLSAIKSFYNFLLRRQIVESNPAKKITSLRTPKRLPHFIEKGKSDTLIAICSEPSDDFTTELHSSIVTLFYSSGMRLSELIALNMEDLDLNLGEIKIKGKGRKERISPLPALATDKLTSYIKLRLEQLEQVGNMDEKALFISVKGNRISRTAVYRLINQSLTLLGVEGKCSPHVLRHTFATHLLGAGVGIESVGDLLGHESLTTTQIYAHNTIEQLKQVHKECFEKE